jgi:hypothetical protein
MVQRHPAIISKDSSVLAETSCGISETFNSGIALQAARPSGLHA